MRRSQRQDPTFVPVGLLGLGPVVVSEWSPGLLTTDPGANGNGASAERVRKAEVDAGINAQDDLLPAPPLHVQVTLRQPNGNYLVLNGHGDHLANAISCAFQSLALQPFSLDICANKAPRARDSADAAYAEVVVSAANGTAPRRLSTGIGSADDEETAIALATLRALHSASLLRAEFRSVGQREIRRAAERLAQEIVTTLDLPDLPAERMGRVVQIIGDEMNRFAVGQVIASTNAVDPVARLKRYDASCVITDRSGRILDHDTDTDQWWRWYPGLKNDALTLRTVLDTMPAAPPGEIPWIVRLFENPRSWIHLRGAIELRQHDILHVVLGRGLLDQDEAFVIGFTMGTAKRLTRLEQACFRWVVNHLYPEPYRIQHEILAAYDVGVQAGTTMGVPRVYELPLENYLDTPLGEVRAELGIDRDRLATFYRQEKCLLPGTLASARLMIGLCESHDGERESADRVART